MYVNYDYKISIETLGLINNEYQTFISKRNLDVNHIK